MKGVKLNLNMDVVNCVLLVVILALVIYCVVKQNEGFTASSNIIEQEKRDSLAKHQKKAAAARKSPKGIRKPGGFDFNNGIPDRLTP